MENIEKLIFIINREFIIIIVIGIVTPHQIGNFFIVGIIRYRYGVFPRTKAANALQPNENRRLTG